MAARMNGESATSSMLGLFRDCSRKSLVRGGSFNLFTRFPSHSHKISHVSRVNFVRITKKHGSTRITFPVVNTHSYHNRTFHCQTRRFHLAEKLSANYQFADRAPEISNPTHETAPLTIQQEISDSSVDHATNVHLNVAKEKFRQPRAEGLKST